jgi:branched-chain amino acid transport system permease protein
LSLVLQNLALQFFGSAPKSVITPYTNSIITIGDVVISQAKLFACMASVAIMGGLWLFMRGSWLGRALRATSDDPSAAGAAGISVRRMHSLAFAIGVGLAALAGTLLATFHAVSPTVGQNYVIIMFVAVVLGGLGSIAGAALGALIVGVVASVSVVEVPLQLQNVLVFGLFVVILLVRPQGLFGHGARV